MYRLLTFGGLRLLRDDGSPTDLAAQRRRIAVLVAVAAAAPRGISRDRLLLLLWPDADADRGRHALNQIVYNLRRELGTSPIEGTTELALVPSVMTSDLNEFRAAIASNDHERAATLYRGPFLDDFFVPGAPEFGHWVDGERMRNAHLAQGAIEKVIMRAEEAGAVDDRVHWTTQLAELNPLSTRTIIGQMRALESAGRRDSAIAVGRRFEVLSRADGEGDGDEAGDGAVQAEIARLLRTPVSIPAIVANALPTAVAESLGNGLPIAVSRITEPAAAQPAIAAVHTLVAPAVQNTQQTDRDEIGHAVRPPVAVLAPRSRRARAMIVLGLLLTTALGIGALVSRAVRPRVPLAADDRLVLAQALLVPNDTLRARAFTLALQTALQQSARVHLLGGGALGDALRRMGGSIDTTRITDAVARELAMREGARYVLQLSVASDAGRSTVTLQVQDPATSASIDVFRNTVPADQILAGIDEVADAFRRGVGEAPADIATRLALPRATTTSLEALQLFASAAAANSRALNTEARELLQRAVVIDSAFALAWVALAQTHYILNQPDAGDSALARAQANNDRLTERERMVIEATAPTSRNDWGQSADRWRRYLQRFPADFDRLAMLAYALMRADRSAEAIAAYDSLRAHRPLVGSELMTLAAVHGQRGHFIEQRRSHAAALALDSGFLRRSIQNADIGGALMRLGHVDSARAVFAVMLQGSPGDRARGLRSLAYADLWLCALDSGIARMQAAVLLDETTQVGALSLARDRGVLAAMLVERGDTIAARITVTPAISAALGAQLDPRVLFWLGRVTARLGDRTMTHRLRDSARAFTRPGDDEQTAATLALDALAHGLDGDLRGAVALARRARAPDPIATYSMVLVQALLSAKDTAAARVVLAELRTNSARPFGNELQPAQRDAPLLAAQLAQIAGDTTSARAAWRDFTQQCPTAIRDYPPARAVAQRLGFVDSR